MGAEGLQTRLSVLQHDSALVDRRLRGRVGSFFRPQQEGKCTDKDDATTDDSTNNGWCECEIELGTRTLRGDRSVLISLIPRSGRLRVVTVGVHPFFFVYNGTDFVYIIGIHQVIFVPVEFIIGF